MKRFILTLVFIVVANMIGPAMAQQCGGMAPLPPLGCKNPHCVCDTSGHCHWEFDCNR
jgi:hypothetical protein